MCDFAHLFLHVQAQKATLKLGYQIGLGQTKTRPISWETSHRWRRSSGRSPSSSWKKNIWNALVWANSCCLSLHLSRTQSWVYILCVICFLHGCLANLKNWSDAIRVSSWARKTSGSAPKNTGFHAKGHRYPQNRILHGLGHTSAGHLCQPGICCVFSYFRLSKTWKNRLYFLFRL